MKPPEHYRTVKQPPGSQICGACLVAMITGQDLKLVRSAMTHTTKGEYTYYKEQEIIKYLASLGVYVGLRAIPLHPRSWHPANLVEFKWEFYDHPAILAVKSKIYDCADHWVFWDGKVVRDSSWTSENETDELQDYDILEIIPILYTEDEDYFPPPGKKLHDEDCPCISCATKRECSQKV